MAIRAKNIDFGSDLMKRTDIVTLGDVTATLVRNIGVVSYACEVKQVDFVSQQAMSANSSQTLNILVWAGTTATILGARATGTTTGVNTNNLAANTVYTVSSSGSVYISAGTVIGIQVSAACGVLSQVLASIKYVPRLHRESR